MEKKHKGAHGELVATVWLLKEGYEVFRNISSHGDVDIIAMKDGALTLFDVKTISLKQDGSPSISTLKSSQIDLGVKLLCVTPADECLIFDGDAKLHGGEDANCEVCAAPFKMRNHRQRFCTTECLNVNRMAQCPKTLSAESRKVRAAKKRDARWAKYEKYAPVHRSV